MIVAKKEHNNRLAKRELMLMIAIHWAIIGKRYTQRARYIQQRRKRMGGEEEISFTLVFVFD